MQKGYIREIRRFTTTDGQGIRSILYTLGCNLRCAWCSSPITWKKQLQVYLNTELCNNCGLCADICPIGRYKREGNSIQIDTSSHCVLCSRCISSCPQHSISIIGQYVSSAEVLNMLLRDVFFYEETSGGVTMSGGEPLLQFDFIREIIYGLLENNVPVSIETNLSINWNKLKQVAVENVCFHVDLKHMDPELHKALTGVDNILIHENIRRIRDSDAGLRIGYPYIPGFNDSVENIDAMISFLKDLRIPEIHLYPLHKLGVIEYNGIGLMEKGAALSQISTCTNELIQRAVSLFSSNGIAVEVERITIS